MSDAGDTGGKEHGDVAPGDSDAQDFGPVGGVRGYVIGLGLATLLTLASFLLPTSGFVWGPAIAPALVALGVAQMGVHLAFFLHITTGPDNTNNTLALAFGVLIVGLVMLGSIWIMSHLNHNMMPMNMLVQHMR